MKYPIFTNLWTDNWYAVKTEQPINQIPILKLSKYTVYTIMLTPKIILPYENEVFFLSIYLFYSLLT